MGEKRRRKYIFMFAGMSASASIPPAAVIGKVRRGDSRTQLGQGESGAGIEAFQWKGENNVATSSGSRFLLFLYGVHVCALVSLIQTGSILFYFHESSIHSLKVQFFP